MLYNDLRPRTFDQIIGQSFIVDNLQQQSIQDKYFNVYIFGGQYGSGKTTLSRIIAMAANCTHKDENGNPCGECESCKAILNEATVDYQEIDGASNTGVDSVRRLKENIAFLPSVLKYKIIVIDEVHMLSKQAFNALLKTLEEPPEYCIFILCTTEVNSIPVTIRSRAACYNFGRIQSVEMASYLLAIAENRNIQLDKDACSLITKASDGSMRNALSILDQCIVMDSHVTAKNVMQIAGLEPITTCFSLITAICKKDLTGIYEMAHLLYQNGKDAILVLDDVLDALGSIVQYRLRNNDSSFLVNTEEYVQNVQAISSLCKTEDFISMTSDILEIRMTVKKDNNPSILLTSLISLTSKMSQIDAMQKEIESLKQQLQSLSSNRFHDAVDSSGSSYSTLEDSSVNDSSDSSVDDVYPNSIHGDNFSEQYEEDSDEFDVNTNISLSNPPTDIEDASDIEDIEEPPCPDPEEELQEELEEELEEELNDNEDDVPASTMNDILPEEACTFQVFGMSFSFPSPRQ